MIHHSFASFCCSLTLATALTAQNDFDLDKTAPGTLGGTLGLLVRNAQPNRACFVLLSGNGGPTPLAGLGLPDPRSLEVGTDLSFLWYFQVTSPTGTLTQNFNIPANPGLHGWAIHWQVVTFPGPVSLADQISNKVVTQLGTAGTAVTAPGALPVPRVGALGFFNRDRNAGQGDFVLAGGGLGTQIWNFRKMTGVAGPNLVVSRSLHTATVLNDGRVLLAGGVDGNGVVVNSCELYDPVANSFSATGSMGGMRAMHAAVRLADGRVMVAGGTSNAVDIATAISNVLGTAEIYNPATGNWSAAAAIGGRRLTPALSLLAAGPNSGRVMVSGGVEVTFIGTLPINAVSTNKAQIYNHTNNTWANGPNMASGRAGHDTNQVTLLDGRLLLTGGVLVPSLVGAQNSTSISAAEYYDPVANTWAPANMAQARAVHTATRLGDGRVVVCGGQQGLLSAPVAFDGVEIFNPATNSWSGLPNLVSTRGAHAAALLPDGMLVLLGGQGGPVGAALATVETLRF